MCERYCDLLIGCEPSGVNQVSGAGGTGNGAGTYAARIRLVPADITATIAPDGKPVTLSTSAPGQQGAWTFSGTAGQQVDVAFTGGTFSDAEVDVYGSGGSRMFNITGCGTSCTLYVTPPTTGSYTIRLVPVGASTGSLRATASSSVSAAVAADGKPVTLTTAIPGQIGAWTFTGTANQQVNFAFTNGTFGSAEVDFYGPDGSYLFRITGCGTSCTAYAIPAVTGAYTVRLFAGASTGSLTATASSLVTAAVATDGKPITLTTTIPGKIGAWTFAGTANKQVNFAFTSGTFASAEVDFYRPDGTYMFNVTGCGTSCTAYAVPPTTGTYTIKLFASGLSTGSLTATESPLVTAVLANDGKPVTLTTTIPAQAGAWTFAGTAGQRVNFSFSNVATEHSGTRNLISTVQTAVTCST